MRNPDFSQASPGRLVKASGPSADYWAFDPDPLPPRLALPIETVRRLSKADRALGELKGVGRMLPNPQLLIGPFLRREAVASSRIEGTVTDVRQLVLFEAAPASGSGLGEEVDDDRREVLNYVDALTFGIERLGSLSVSLHLMREVHERLMAGVRGEDKRPGQFRDRQNMIGRVGQTLDQARFVPPPVLHMKDALHQLERYIRGDSELPVLVDLALIHYQFETIHPFLDGNGRLGRLLISLLLCEWDVLPQPLMYLSDYFEEHKTSYTDHLLRVSQSGDWIGWIDFFLDGVALQSRKGVARCNQLLALWNEYRDLLQRVGQSSNLLRLLDLLFERPAISVTQVERRLGLTYRAAQQNVERLVREDILVEVTHQKRNRIYLAPRILDIVEAP